MSSLKKRSNEQIIFECTAKGMQALSSNKQLKGKARQFCLLLLNDDDVSLKLISKLRDKVNIEKLIEVGYIRLVTKSYDSNPKLTRKTSNKRKSKVDQGSVSRVIIKESKCDKSGIDKPFTKVLEDLEFKKPKRQSTNLISANKKKVKIKLMESAFDLESSMGKGVLQQQSIMKESEKKRQDKTSAINDVSPMLQLAAGQF